MPHDPTPDPFAGERTERKESAHHDHYREPFDPVRNRYRRAQPLANLLTLPGLPKPPRLADSLKTYAAWPVWKDSTTKTVRFQPLPKKQAATRWHKAKRFDLQTHEPGKHGGAVGRTALEVLRVLLFEFLDYMTGQLDPSYDAIAQKAGICRRAVAAALQRLRTLGLLHWQRRCSEDKDGLGRFRLKQESNAYAVLPPSQWRGYYEPPPAPPPEPGTWGDHPPLPDPLAQGLADLQSGDSARAVLNRLRDDPADRLAGAVAGLFGSVFATAKS